MPIITIRGTTGSGTPETGELIARKLGIDYVDQKIIADVAERLRTSSESVAKKELPASTFLGRVAEAIRTSYAFDGGYADVSLPMWGMPLDDSNYLLGLEHVISEMAKSRSIVIRGRGSHLILKDFPAAFHIMVVAPLALRVKRVMEEMNLDEKEARSQIKRLDNGNREFVKKYFNAEIEDLKDYDLVINTGSLSFEAAASIVVNAVPLKEATKGAS
jgi:cytidylate kinase